MSYLKKRHNTWYARMGIPSAARPILGRIEFVKSLETTSKATAQSRAVVYIAQWKEQIAAAVSGDTIKQEANWWRTAYENAASNDDFDTLTLVIQDRAEDIERKGSQADAKRFYELATGKAVDLSEHLESWFEVRKTEVSEKYAYTSRQRVSRMAERFKLSTAVNRKDVIAWIEEQRSELAVITVRKIIKSCDEYWKYLQARELLEEGVSPFESHTIKAKPKESIYKDMQPYSKSEVVNLHRQAVSKKKDNLALAIRMGAYTGFRQDEICQLTVDDVVDVEGIRCLTLRDSKTKAGHRTVPIAEKLLPMVNELVESARQRGDDYLLPNETVDRYGKRSRNMSKQFTVLKQKLGFSDVYDFHSIRRTVATLLEQAQVDELHAARLLGHKIKTMSYGLYSGGASMDVLKKAVDTISYGEGSF